MSDPFNYCPMQRRSHANGDRFGELTMKPLRQSRIILSYSRLELHHPGLQFELERVGSYRC